MIYNNDIDLELRDIIMRFVDLIDKKAHGEALATDEIQTMVDGFVKGDIPD